MKVLKIIGTGIFIFLAVFEFSGLVEYLAEQFLFITNPGSQTILWLPQLLGIVVYSVVVIWMVKKSYNSEYTFSGKSLGTALVIFFALMLLKFLYSFYGTGLLYGSFPEEFEAFHRLKDENRDIQGLMGFIPTLKYIILAGILLVIGNHLANRNN